MVKRKPPSEQKYFSHAPTPTMVRVYRVDRRLRAELLLVENIRTLLSQRKLDASALAAWCQHKPAWISKILSGERNAQLNDLGAIADFFGLTVAQLFSYDISPLVERRRRERRSSKDRRSGQERRQATATDRRQPNNSDAKDHRLRSANSFAADSSD